jgi:hypothetical protein
VVAAVDEFNVIEFFEQVLEMLPVLVTVTGVDHQHIFIVHEPVEIGIVHRRTGCGGDQCVLGPPVGGIQRLGVVGQRIL